MALNNLCITLSQSLISKNVAFCLYRFPGEDHFRIAIDEAFLPHEKEKTFWVAPFCQFSAAHDIYLAVLNQSFLTEDFLKEIDAVAEQAPFADLPLPIEKSKQDYYDRIHAFLKDIRSGKLEKAILSRVFYENKPEDFDVPGCFLRLAESYPQTFVHLLVHPESGVWLGATPELLMRKRNEEIATMALAGTQKRKQMSEYEWRIKEREEHLMVGGHIEKIFSEYNCTLQKAEGPHYCEAGGVVHLQTDYLFKANPNLDLRSFLMVLHPTPAVGGLPADKGIECILEHEGYDRRYYCGFLGETDFKTSADLYINLRNMQVGKDKIVIFVGGGITSASDPDEEWLETVMKSKTMVEKIFEA
ncbi:MAG: chorismate-binding protein [Chitinophagaceae bacterium]|nr:chorismate-binding protein [Chitinophagaceae bacterium]